MIDERALATVTDYNEMIAAIRSRMRELGVTNETVDAITGLPSGYTGKLIAANATKNMGRMSFGAILQGLGMKLIVVEDPATTEKMRPRWTQREKARIVLAPARIRKHIPVFDSRSARRARKLQLERMSAEEMSRRGTLAVNARWKRYRMRKRLRAQAAKQQAGACA